MALRVCVLSTGSLCAEKAESLTSVCVCSFIPYLKQFIDLDNTDMEWVNTAKEYPDLLTFHGPETMGFEFFGTTDVAVALRSAARSAQ